MRGGRDAVSGEAMARPAMWRQSKDMRMNTRTFHAASVQDAIRRARHELGADAMLLNSRRVPAPEAGEEDQFAVKFAYAHAAPASFVKTDAVLSEGAVASAYPLALRVHEPPRRRPAGLGGFEFEKPAPRGQPVVKPGTVHSGTVYSGAVHSDVTRSGFTQSVSRPGVTHGLSENAGADGGAFSGASEEGMLSRGPVPAEADSSSGESRERAASSTNAAVPSDAAAAESFEKLRDQMFSMRREMLQLAGSVRRVSAASYRQKLASDSLRYLHDLLVEQDFHADLIERILLAVSETPAAGPSAPAARGQKASTGKVRSVRSPRKRSAGVTETVPEHGDARLFAALQDAIATHVDLMAEPGLRRKRSSPLVISLVGPPGAGKTTTLVKLAVRYSELSRFPLQIVSMDNFRVGASEQLRAYAAVLGVGFDTLTTVPALERALREYSSKEIILIDTPGLGWRDFDAADDLAAFLRGLDHKITHMVAPASMRPADFERLADLYEAFDYESLIYTKLDETASIGQLVSESWRRKKPLAYFATGQRIPDDLELASRERICERILPSDSLSAHFAA